MRITVDKGSKDKKKHKSLIKNLRITEVSSVGRGANEGALVTLMKTADIDHVNKEKEIEDMEELQKELDEQKAKSEDLASKLAKSEFLASLNDLQKAHYDGLDEEGKGAFEAASGEDRDKLIKDAIEKAEAADEKIEINGNEIRKSVVGAEGFELLKAAEAEKTLLRETIAKKEQEELQKQLIEDAEKNLPHLGGSPEKKAEIWKFAREDEGMKEVLKAADAHAESLTQDVGVSSATHPDALEPKERLEKMVAAKVKEGLKRPQAMDAVLETQEGKDLYEKI